MARVRTGGVKAEGRNGTTVCEAWVMGQGGTKRVLGYKCSKSNSLDDDLLAHACGPQGHFGASESLAPFHAVEVAGEFNLASLVDPGWRHRFQ